MKMTRELDMLLKRRADLAYKLREVNHRVDTILEEKLVIDLSDPLISSGVLDASEIYTDPYSAETIVRDYIKEKGDE